MAWDWSGGGGAVTMTAADVYGNDAGSTDFAVSTSGGSAGSVGGGETTTSAVAGPATPTSTWNPLLIGLGAFVAIALAWKLFHEWGRDEAEFKDIEIDLHNWGAVLVLVFAGVPGVKAVLAAVPWPWANWGPWQAFVNWCLQA